MANFTCSSNLSVKLTLENMPIGRSRENSAVSHACNERTELTDHQNGVREQAEQQSRDR